MSEFYVSNGIAWTQALAEAYACRPERNEHVRCLLQEALQSGARLKDLVHSCPDGVSAVFQLQWHFVMCEDPSCEVCTATRARLLWTVPTLSQAFSQARLSYDSPVSGAHYSDSGIGVQASFDAWQGRRLVSSISATGSTDLVECTQPQTLFYKSIEPVPVQATSHTSQEAVTAFAINLATSFALGAHSQYLDLTRTAGLGPLTGAYYLRLWKQLLEFMLGDDVYPCDDQADQADDESSMDSYINNRWVQDIVRRVLLHILTYQAYESPLCRAVSAACQAGSGHMHRCLQLLSAHGAALDHGVRFSTTQYDQLQIQAWLELVEQGLSEMEASAMNVHVSRVVNAGHATVSDQWRIPVGDIADDDGAAAAAADDDDDRDDTDDIDDDWLSDSDITDDDGNDDDWLSESDSSDGISG